MICRTCSTDKPLAEYYVDRRNGLPQRHCKECSRVRARARYATEEYKAWSRDRQRARRSDPDRLAKDRETLRLWRLSHPDRYVAQYRAQNVKAYNADPDKSRARSRLRPKEKHLAAQNKRRARMLGNGGNGVSREEWEEIVAAHDYACAYCKNVCAKLTRDHVVPIVKGGADEPSNTVPACQRCNSRKGKRLLSELPKDFFHASA